MLERVSTVDGLGGPGGVKGVVRVVSAARRGLPGSGGGGGGGRGSNGAVLLGLELLHGSWPPTVGQLAEGGSPRLLLRPRVHLGRVYRVAPQLGQGWGPACCRRGSCYGWRGLRGRHGRGGRWALSIGVGKLGFDSNLVGGGIQPEVGVRDLSTWGWALLGLRCGGPGVAVLDGVGQWNVASLYGDTVSCWGKKKKNSHHFIFSEHLTHAVIL